MKRFNVVLFAFVLFFGINLAEAQNKRLNTGIRVGTALTNFNGDDISGSNSLMVFNGGFFLNYSPIKWFTIQTEANLSFKGGTYDLKLNGFPYHKVKVIYAQIPLLIKFSSKSELGSTGFKPSIFLGPALNLRLDAELEGMPLENVAGAYSLNQRTEPVAYELIGGIGGTIKDFYVIDLRYGYSLSNIFKQGNVKTSSIALSLGIKF